VNWRYNTRVASHTDYHYHELKGKRKVKRVCEAYINTGWCHCGDGAISCLGGGTARSQCLRYVRRYSYTTLELNWHNDGRATPHPVPSAWHGSHGRPGRGLSVR